MISLICLGSLLALGRVYSFGLDYPEPFSLSDVQCFRANGASLVIPRAWHSYGAFDTNAIPNINTAWQAGIPSVDVYHFPCRSMSAS